MLIKYYNLENDLHIIENISDVVVLGDIMQPIERMSIGEIATELNAQNNKGLRSAREEVCLDFGGKQSEYRVIRYTQNYELKQLMVQGVAFVCSDEGKTIEKVSP